MSENVYIKLRKLIKNLARQKLHTKHSFMVANLINYVRLKANTTSHSVCKFSVINMQTVSLSTYLDSIAFTPYSAFNNKTFVRTSTPINDTLLRLPQGVICSLNL